jgi:hypothetical protein
MRWAFIVVALPSPIVVGLYLLPELTFREFKELVLLFLPASFFSFSPFGNKTLKYTSYTGEIRKSVHLS